MTDRTLREKIEWLVEKAPSSDEDKGWNEAVTEVLRILDAHPAPPAIADAPVSDRPGPDAVAEAAKELAECASYAEMVGGISVNRPQIRKWCDKIFSALANGQQP